MSEDERDISQLSAAKMLRDAKKEAVNLFTEWLKKRHGRDLYANRREELMKSCTHPEDRRIYPDDDQEAYPDGMVWHCLNCGYAEYEGGRK